MRQEIEDSSLLDDVPHLLLAMAESLLSSPVLSAVRDGAALRVAEDKAEAETAERIHVGDNVEPLDPEAAGWTEGVVVGNLAPRSWLVVRKDDGRRPAEAYAVPVRAVAILRDNIRRKVWDTTNWCKIVKSWQQVKDLRKGLPPRRREWGPLLRELSEGVTISQGTLAGELLVQSSTKDKIIRYIHTLAYCAENLRFNRVNTSCPACDDMADVARYFFSLDGCSTVRCRFAYDNFPEAECHGDLPLQRNATIDLLVGQAGAAMAIIWCLESSGLRRRLRHFGVLNDLLSILRNTTIYTDPDPAAEEDPSYYRVLASDSTMAITANAATAILNCSQDMPCPDRVNARFAMWVVSNLSIGTRNQDFKPDETKCAFAELMTALVQNSDDLCRKLSIKGWQLPQDYPLDMHDICSGILEQVLFSATSCMRGYFSRELNSTIATAPEQLLDWEVYRPYRLVHSLWSLLLEFSRWSDVSTWRDFREKFTRPFNGEWWRKLFLLFDEHALAFMISRTTDGGLAAGHLGNNVPCVTLSSLKTRAMQTAEKRYVEQHKLDVARRLAIGLALHPRLGSGSQFGKLQDLLVSFIAWKACPTRVQAVDSVARVAYPLPQVPALRLQIGAMAQPMNVEPGQEDGRGVVISCLEGERFDKFNRGVDTCLNASSHAMGQAAQAAGTQSDSMVCTRWRLAISERETVTEEARLLKPCELPPTETLCFGYPFSQ